MTVGGSGATEDHVVAITQRYIFANRCCALGDGQALTRQSGLGGVKCGRFDEPGVGWNGVAFLNENDVARHDLRGGNTLALAVPNDGRISR